MKTKLNDKETRWIKELITFNFTNIYYKKIKNLINNLFRRSDFKDDNELSTIRRQLLLNFLFKFQKHLKNIKSNLIEEQNIDFNKTPLLRSVLSLIRAPQDINSIKILSIKNEYKNNPTKEQSIDSNKTPLLGNVLNLIKTL